MDSRIGLVVIVLAALFATWLGRCITHMTVSLSRPGVLVKIGISDTIRTNLCTLRSWGEVVGGGVIAATTMQIPPSLEHAR